MRGKDRSINEGVTLVYAVDQLAGLGAYIAAEMVVGTGAQHEYEHTVGPAYTEAEVSARWPEALEAWKAGDHRLAIFACMRMEVGFTADDISTKFQNADVIDWAETREDLLRLRAQIDQLLSCELPPQAPVSDSPEAAAA